MNNLELQGTQPRSTSILFFTLSQIDTYVQLFTYIIIPHIHYFFNIFQIILNCIQLLHHLNTQQNARPNADWHMPRLPNLVLIIKGCLDLLNLAKKRRKKRKKIEKCIML